MVSFEKEFPSLNNILNLRRFCDYEDYLLAEKDERYESFAYKDVVLALDVIKHCIDKRRLRDLVTELEEVSETGYSAETIRIVDITIKKLRLLLGDEGK